MTDARADRTARLAGAFYLLLFVCGFFTLFVRASLIEPGEAATTIANIAGSEFLFRLAIVAEFVLALAYLMVAFCLRRFFEKTDPALSLLFFTIAAIGVTLIFANTLNQIALLELATNARSPGMPDDSLRTALAMLFTWLLNNGWVVIAIATGLWLLPLGIAVLRSRHFPDFLGYLLIIGCFGYLVPVAITFLLPAFAAINLPIMSISGIAEMIFGIWLVAFGASRRTQRV